MIGTKRSTEATVTITVAIDDDEPRVFTTNLTTTGDPFLAVGSAVSRVGDEAGEYLDRAERPVPGYGPPTAARITVLRHAAVTGEFSVAGQREALTELTVETAGNIFGAANGLVMAARLELRSVAARREGRPGRVLANGPVRGAVRGPAQGPAQGPTWTLGLILGTAGGVFLLAAMVALVRVFSH